jgi:hypothetical protein
MSRHPGNEYNYLGQLEAHQRACIYKVREYYDSYNANEEEDGLFLRDINVFVAGYDDVCEAYEEEDIPKAPSPQKLEDVEGYLDSVYKVYCSISHAAQVRLLQPLRELFDRISARFSKQAEYQAVPEDEEDTDFDFSDSSSDSSEDAVKPSLTKQNYWDVLEMEDDEEEKLEHRKPPGWNEV